MATTSIDRGFELTGETSSLRQILRDIWTNRGLIRILSRKDFFVRYRRASFGVLWAVGLPLVQALVLAVIFTKIVKIPTVQYHIPYPVYVFSGILPWTFFSGSVGTGVNTIVEGNSIATRIYFPRAILPLVNVTSGMYGYTPGLVILVVLAVGFGVPIGLQLLWIFPAAAVMFLLSAAFSLVLAGMQVYFRDMRHIIAAIMLPWFWVSAVFFPLERLGNLRRWVEINPATGMIQLYRAAFGAAAPHFETAVWWTLGWTVVLLVAAGLIHRRYDRVFVDLL
jgi:lipopolysaccharide transport system permease protein